MKTILIQSKSRAAFMAVLLLIFFCSNRSACGQWQLMGQFPPSQGWPVAIQTLYGDSVLLVGFERGGVWRTTDAGTTWQNTLPAFCWVSDFAFKNDTEGWLSNEGGFVNLVYHTTNAGLTWNSVPTPSGNLVYGEELEIIYERASGDLLIMSWDTSNSNLRSTDGGGTWLQFGPKALFNLWWYGMVFTNARHAISGYPLGVISPVMMVTNDNWNSWVSVPYPNDGEVWQPLAIPGTDTIISISENEGWETRSLDGGYTWTWLPRDTSLGMTGGPVWCDCGSVALSQDRPEFTPGILYSTDLGTSWIPVGGPSNIFDTRIFYSGHYIYAGSYIEADSNFAVYRYTVHHYPTVTYPANLQTCSRIDTSFHISFTNTCFGITASLDSFALTGSPAFSLQPLQTPHVLANEEDIFLHYNPLPGAHDTAQLYLRFNQHGDIKDTILTFTGSGPQPDYVKLHCAASASHATPGKTFSIDIFPDQSVSNASLDTISFSLNYANDVLNFLGATSGVAGTLSVQNGEASIPITIIGNNLSLDPTKPIVTLTFEAMLSDTLHTTLALLEPIANPSDKSYGECVLSLSADSTPFNLDLVCGNTTILAAMQSQPPFSIVSIQPNPANGFIKVEGSSGPFTIFDPLGRSYEVSCTANTLDISSLPSGVYFVSDGFSRAKFVKE